MLIISFFVFLFCFVIVFGEENYHYDFFTYTLTVLVSAAAIIHIFPLTAAVSNDAKRKSLNSRIIWTFLTFVFGLPVAVLYVLFTFKAGKYSNRKENKKTIINGITAVLLLAVFLFGSCGVIECIRNYESTHFPAYIETYKNSDGEEFIYDKMGNTYTFEESKNFRYYDRNGNSYTAVTYTPLFSSESEIDYLQCVENNKKFDRTEREFFIDNDGYLIIEEYDESRLNYEGYDIYNIPQFCSWTSDGKLIVKDRNYL